jgi:DNA-binding XRE family transcriptional regulator
MAVRLQLPRKKALNPTDKHVGSRVRMRRMMLAMSQEKLGAALGITYQQVQKNEKGANRIGASRLQQISHRSSSRARRTHQRHTAPMEARYRRPRLTTSSPIQTALG